MAYKLTLVELIEFVESIPKEEIIAGYYQKGDKFDVLGHIAKSKGHKPNANAPWSSILPDKVYWKHLGRVNDNSIYVGRPIYNKFLSPKKRVINYLKKLNKP